MLPAVRQIFELEQAMQRAAGKGEFEPFDFPLTHHFAPGVYAREMFIPAGYVLTGKIHKHAHLNMVLKGKIAVATPEGKKIIEAPAVFVSPPMTKRAGFAIEDTIWVTVHATEHQGEDKLDLIESEVIADRLELE